MSLTACKTFANVASKLLRTTTTVRNAALHTKMPMMASRGLQTQRSFTRSMWVLSGGRSDARGTDKPCGCCGLHTTGDQELSEFLSEEISHEKKVEKTPGSLPQIKGYSVKSDGTVLTLSKDMEGERVSIEMNINHSVEDAAGADYEASGNQEPAAAEMVARPPFTVKFNKGGDMTLAIQCEFPVQEDFQPPAEGEEFIDVIEISEVAMLKGEDWDDKIYSVSGSVMDGNLYDMLMNMMEERGIDGTFVDEMVELCTAYDHKQYINFLENLKSFSAK